MAQSVYTVPEVLAEIRDRRARRRLAALPYELQLRRPRADFVRTGECGWGRRGRARPWG